MRHLSGLATLKLISKPAPDGQINETKCTVSSRHGRDVKWMFRASRFKALAFTLAPEMKQSLSARSSICKTAISSHCTWH